MPSIRFAWADLATPRIAPADGASVEIEGCMAPADGHPAPRRFLLVAEAACCAGCPPDPASTIEILAAAPVPRRPGILRCSGTWHRLPAEDPAGWRWRLLDAACTGQVAVSGPWLSRRRLLAALPLACSPALPACAPLPDAERAAAARAVLAATPAMDLHSYAGGVILSRARPRRFGPIAAPMRDGAVGLIALAMVADTPTSQVTADSRIQAYRTPAPGELAAHGEAAFARLHALVRQEGLAVITDLPSLRAAMRARMPAVLVAAEGADFVEGEATRLEAAFATHRLRHLQLLHYRVNQLGDIQTAAPVHEGLTAFGAGIVRACNRLGIVVDVAHASFETTRRVAEVTERPLVLSHTSLSNRPGPRSRLITADHARLVAGTGTGGVIGIWPPVTVYPTLRDYAEGIARAADVVGAAHVGIGTDLRGLLSAAALDEYDQFPRLAEALLTAGFGATEASAVLGGNHARVLAAVLPG